MSSNDKMDVDQVHLEPSDRIIIEKIDSWYQEGTLEGVSDGIVQGTQLSPAGGYINSVVTLSPHQLPQDLNNVTNMSPDHVTNLSPDHVTNLSPDHVTNLSPDHLTNVSPNYVTSLSPNHVTNLANVSHGYVTILSPPIGSLSPDSSSTIVSLTDDPNAFLLPPSVSGSGEHGNNSFTNPIFITDVTGLSPKSEPFSPTGSGSGSVLSAKETILEPRAQDQDASGNPCPPKRMKREGSVTSVDADNKLINFVEFNINQNCVRPILQVYAEKGFQYSEQDQALINQKKNHIQLKIQVTSTGSVKLINGLEISHLQLNLYGIKYEAQNQIVQLEQSDAKRAKKKFDPIRIDFTDGKPWKHNIGRLHFCESTAGNDSRRGKPNPNQRYFQLVIAVEAVTSSGQTITITSVRTNDRIIVRASNPGQFEADSTEGAVWSKSGDGIYYSGKVGVGSPNNHPVAFFVNGDIQTAGNILKPCDRRIKKNILPLSTRSQLQNINKIEIVEYNLRAEYLAGVPETERAKLSEKQVGVVAQDVSKILPDAVIRNPDMWIVNKERLCLENIGAVNELSKQVEKTKRSVKELSMSSDKLNKDNVMFLHKMEKRTEELEERMDDLHLNVNNLNRYSSQHTSLSMVSDYTSLGGKAAILQSGGNSGSTAGRCQELADSRHSCKTRLGKKLQAFIVLALSLIALSIFGICIVYGYNSLKTSQDIIPSSTLSNDTFSPLNSFGNKFNQNSLKEMKKSELTSTTQAKIVSTTESIVENIIPYSNDDLKGKQVKTFPQEKLINSGDIFDQFDDSNKNKATENKQENPPQDILENLQNDTNEIFDDKENFDNQINDSVEDTITSVENMVNKYATNGNIIPSSTEKSSLNKSTSTITAKADVSNNEIDDQLPPPTAENSSSQPFVFGNPGGSTLTDLVGKPGDKSSTTVKTSSKVEETARTSQNGIAISLQESKAAYDSELMKNTDIKKAQRNKRLTDTDLNGSNDIQQKIV